MHIVQIAAEIAPIAKVGGLGDVLLGISHELVKKGHQVEIIIPKYDCMESHEIEELTVAYEDLPSFFEGKWHQNTVWKGKVRGLTVYFIEPHHPARFFERQTIYGCPDDIDRFFYFSRAVMELLLRNSPEADILHLHDWQTAVIPILYKDLFFAQGFTHPRTLLTIHNIAYQGLCAPDDLEKIGLSGHPYLSPNKLQDPHNNRQINLLKGGIVFSDFVTTVSPKYAEEVLTPEGGQGLESTLLQHRHKFSGILNGLDYSYWNPEIDPYLPVSFSSYPEAIVQKKICKQKLREKTKMNGDSRPIVGCVARLVPQKGIELIKHAIFHTIANKGQFVLLGSSPIPEVQAEFETIKKKLNGNSNVSLNLKHNEELAHLIFAGSDIFIVPSLFEPCGLTQLIALRYGTIPVVRHTGGLADTIYDIDDSEHTPELTNGYSFDHPNTQGIEYALDRAIACWYQQPERWQNLMIKGMNMDFSWGNSSERYLSIYREIAKKPHQENLSLSKLVI